MLVGDRDDRRSERLVRVADQLLVRGGEQRILCGNTRLCFRELIGAERYDRGAAVR